MSEIIDFYNFLPNKNGMTIDQVWKMSLDELDHCHDFIQYLFPTQEVSRFHTEAPLLTEKDIKEFKENPVLREHLTCSFGLMLEFFGMETRCTSDTIKIVKAENYEERRLVWQTPFNHNLLRVTRILTCLRLCDLENEAEAFYNCLVERVLEDNFWEISLETIEFWQDAIRVKI